MRDTHKTGSRGKAVAASPPRRFGAGSAVVGASDADDRWPALVATLVDLSAAHRRAVRIVDADCGAGDLLIRAVIEARRLGFVAIEGLGIDGSPTLVHRARLRAAALHDPAIGLEFALCDACRALEEEASFPADIILCRSCEGVAARTASAAGDTVIAGRGAAGYAS